MTPRPQSAVLQRFQRPLSAFVHDVAMAAAAFLLAIYLRMGDDIATIPLNLLIGYTAGFAAIAGIVYRATGLYRGLWRYASLSDLVALVRATTLVVLVAALVFFIATRLEALPRSTFVIGWFVMLALLGGPRFIYRAIKDRGLRGLMKSRRMPAVPVLLIGVRDSADAFIREMARDPEAPYWVVGLVADAGERAGGEISGVPVLGAIDTLAEVVAELDSRGRRPQRLIIAARGTEGAVVRRILDVADRLAIPLARLPRLTEFRDTGADGRGRIEPVAIEDLLGRPQAVLDRPSMRALVEKRCVLITGAGGTIGAELARQVAALAPRRLVLLDNGEYQLYAIDREILEAHPDLSRLSVIGDVRERQRIDEVIAAERPELVFHAAALKHVPIVEANPIEGVATNALGAYHVAEACRAHGVATMVLVSTDKAVNPANVMGAAKRTAELICQSLDLVEARKPRGTRYVTVRFGNVLGSSGSVVPLFQRQLAAGGPLTVTHPEITRFFMTVREAVELVLQSAALALEDNARGKVYVLDMGEPVKIVDLARQMIRLAGRRPDAEIAIEFVGLRPGEKLHEELFYADEALAPTRIPSIRLASPHVVDWAVLNRALDELEEETRARHAGRVLDLLSGLVPGFARPQAAQLTGSSR